MSGSERVTPKRLHVITWGCQMNVYDSGRMADVLAPLGYTPAPVPEGADMVILNTCHIRDKAAEKVFSELGTIRRLKAARQRNGRTMLVAVGARGEARQGDASEHGATSGNRRVDDLRRCLTGIMPVTYRRWQG